MVVPINAVVIDNGVATVAAGDADEWAGRIFSVAFAAGGLLCR